MSHSVKQPNFDPIARSYRWLEYLTLGRALERCRVHFLPQIADKAHALVLGDGDGRFIARLLAQNPSLTADVVDTSAAMLQLLRDRCAFAAARLFTCRADAITFTKSQPAVVRYDLIVTHFFLDCLTQLELDDLAASIAPLTKADSLWLVSDFRVPPGLMRLPARMLVRLLYVAFRVLTGLRPTRLPDHVSALSGAGLACLASHRSLFGVLTTELWRRQRSDLPCAMLPQIPHLASASANVSPDCTCTLESP